MDIEKLIERLKECSTYGFKQEICGEAATALSTLQAENAQLRAALEKVKAERDAAEDALPHTCETCIFYEIAFNGCTPDHDCTNPDGGCSNNYDRWQWRGTKEE